MTYTDKGVKRYTITSALPYTNGPVHIGHLAGVYVPADIYARYLRLSGEDVLFIGGSDEHGVPITIKARKEGCSPQDIVDRYHAIIKQSMADFGISFDIYSRTSSSEHHQNSAAFFRKLYEQGKFVERSSQQYYDPEANQFLADRYITGTCPHCGNDHAYGDQCEACGTSLAATDLINPKSTISGAKPEMRETKHWYLPLEQYEEWLRQWILDGHKEDWKSNVYGQCKSWLDAGLQPRAVTRDLDWGVKVPVEGANGKVLYVWFDAPIGYISFTQQHCGGDWEKWWKDSDTKLVHFIGKDNIVFHCIVFPAMLKAEGSYILPANVPANEFLNLEGDKISTSRNWAVWLHEYLTDFPGKQDVLRYMLCANAPETKDNDFTWHDFQLKNNSELVAILGNFVNRTLVLTHKFFEGKVPQVNSHTYTDIDRQTIAELATYPERIGRAIECYRFREALAELMNLARLGNKYLTDTEPWKLFKTDANRTAAVLNLSLQICANLAVLSEPFMPFSADKMKRMLDLTISTSSATPAWRQAGSTTLLCVGHALQAPELLFEKIEDSVIDAQMQRLATIKKQNEETSWQPKNVKPEVAFDDFGKVDIRVGTVLECSKVPKADKLLQFKIDDGMGCRTIVSGIAKYYTDPAALVGKQVCFIANFAPRKLKGVESQGMILSAEDKDGRLVLISPSQLVTNGCNIG
ncbi:MAG: methionine--tRNA ligase [Bacteroidales bacterium]|nr:methionine--tRNA ligase [Candidatus Colimorpha onthohippi]